MAGSGEKGLETPHLPRYSWHALAELLSLSLKGHFATGFGDGDPLAPARLLTGWCMGGLAPFTPELENGWTLFPSSEFSLPDRCLSAPGAGGRAGHVPQAFKSHSCSFCGKTLSLSSIFPLMLQNLLASTVVWGGSMAQGDKSTKQAWFYVQTISNFLNWVG